MSTPSSSMIEQLPDAITPATSLRLNSSLNAPQVCSTYRRIVASITR
jgi:hypothetical protein